MRIKIVLVNKKVVLGMAKPIGETPTLYGEDAIRILRKMKEPPTKEDIEFAKKIKSQRNVPF